MRQRERARLREKHNNMVSRTRRPGLPAISPGLTFLLLIWCAYGVKLTDTKNNTKRVLKATTIEIAPFCMEVKGQGGHDREGFIVDLLGEVAHVMNVTIELNVVKDGRFGHIDEQGNWTGMIGEVISGHADLAAAPLTVRSTRAKHVDMTLPFLTTTLKIVIRKPVLKQMKRGLFIILQPFSVTVWFLIVGAFLLTSGLLTLIGRLSPNEWTNSNAVHIDWEKRSSFNCMNSFWFIFSTFMWQGYRIAPRSYSGRTLSAFWWIFVLATLVLYIGSMTAHLIYNRPYDAYLPFASFEDLSRQKKVAYGVVKGGSTLNYFKTSLKPLEQRIYRTMMDDPSVFVSSVDEGLKKVRESNGDYAFITESLLAEYSIGKEPCDLMSVGDTLLEHLYSFATKKNSPLTSELNHAIIKLQESGTIKLIHNKWWWGVCHNQQVLLDGTAYFDKMATHDVISFTPLDVYLFSGPLILLMCGMILTGIILAAEVYLSRGEIKREEVGEDGHQLRESFSEQT